MPGELPLAYEIQNNLFADITQLFSCRPVDREWGKRTEIAYSPPNIPFCTISCYGLRGHRVSVVACHRRRRAMVSEDSDKG